MTKINKDTQKDESYHHSIILRCWVDSLDELRGQLINPLTNNIYSFTHTSDILQALNRAIDEIMDLEKIKRKEN